MNENKKPKVESFKCEGCRRETIVAYETATMYFLKCKNGHRNNGRDCQPVFMVPKSEFADRGD